MPMSRRDHYHHGDLYNALADAATALASAGGPDAIVLREVARRVGVSATAAYRHFASHTDLLRVVKERAQGMLVDAMRVALSSEPPVPDPGDDAERRLRALGRAYVAFALEHRGLFRACFCDTHRLDDDVPDLGEFEAYRMVAQTLDELVVAGRLSPQGRVCGEVVAWASVHGLAMLLLDGPLRALPDDARDIAVERTLDVIIAGLRTT